MTGGIMYDDGKNKDEFDDLVLLKSRGLMSLKNYEFAMHRSIHYQQRKTSFPQM